MAVVALLILFCAAGPAQNLRGVVDLHAHSDPDSVPRSIDAVDLARLAQSRGMRALVLKNHYEPTASLAYIVRKQVPGIEVFGGIALNRTVGGINAAAVERMTLVKGGWGRVVWMPTFDARNQALFSKDSRPSVPVSRDGALLPAVLEVLDLISKHRLTLATGHSSPAETLLLIHEARKRKIDRILVTHPMVAPVLMSVEQMQEAARLGAKLEFVSNERKPAFYAKAIRAVGPENCIVSSDLGQASNPLHPDGLQAFLKGLAEAGFTARELDLMSKENPAKLLGLR
ncbi:MAG: DUF6282 family protein [Bryobacteraceae bacterium]